MKFNRGDKVIYSNRGRPYLYGEVGRVLHTSPPNGYYIDFGVADEIAVMECNLTPYSKEAMLYLFLDRTLVKEK